MLHVVVGSVSFFFWLWWEAPPCFLLVMSRSCNNKHGELEMRDDVVGGLGASTDVGKNA